MLYNVHTIYFLKAHNAYYPLTQCNDHSPTYTSCMSPSHMGRPSGPSESCTSVQWLVISLLPALLPTSLVGSSVSTLPFSPRCSSPCYRSQPAHTSPSLLSARFLFLLAISARFSIIIGHLCKVRPNFATCPAHEFSPHKFFLLGLHICSSSQVLGQFGWIPLFDTAFNLMCELCPNRSR